MKIPKIAFLVAPYVAYPNIKIINNIIELILRFLACRFVGYIPAYDDECFHSTGGLHLSWEKNH